MKKCIASVISSLMLCSIAGLHAAWQPAITKTVTGPDLLAFNSLREIDERLFAEVKPHTTLESYMRSDLFRAILRSNNDLLWNAMVDESDRPILAIAGFHCIAQAKPIETTAVGLKIFAESKIAGSPLYDPVYEGLLRERDRLAKNKEELPLDAIDRVLLQHARSTHTLFLVLGLVPASDVVRWLRSKDVLKAPPVAVAVAALFVLEEDQNLLTPGETEALLQKLAMCPGFPRSAYAEFGNVSDSNYLRLLRSVLSEENAYEGGLVTIVDRKRELINSNLEYLTRNLPKARLELIRRVLKWGHHKAKPKK